MLVCLFVCVQVSAIDKIMNGKKAILTRIENQPRRKCDISDPFKGSPHVLGKVCIFLYVLVFVSGDPITSAPPLRFGQRSSAHTETHKYIKMHDFAELPRKRSLK